MSRATAYMVIDCRYQIVAKIARTIGWTNPEFGLEFT